MRKSFLRKNRKPKDNKRKGWTGFTTSKYFVEWKILQARLKDKKDWSHIFAKHITEKGLISIIHKELLKKKPKYLNRKKDRNLQKKKDNTQYHMKRCSASLISRDEN